MQEFFSKFHTTAIGHFGLVLLAAGLNSISNAQSLNHALSGLGIQLTGPALGFSLSIVGGMLSYIGKPSGITSVVIPPSPGNIIK